MRKLPEQLKKIIENDTKLKDPNAERMVLSALVQHGSEWLYSIDPILKESFFFYPENRIVYSTIHHLITKDSIDKPNAATIIGKINDIHSGSLEKYQLADYVDLLLSKEVLLSQITPFLNKVIKFGLARNLKLRLEEAQDKIENMEGGESLLEIINEAERPIADFTQSLVTKDETANMVEGLEEYVEYLNKQENKILGISTGYKRLDYFLGGGLRKPGFHMFGARKKVGKSMVALNFANNITKQNVPVLYLDTEMTREIQWNRWLSLNSQIPTHILESGGFANVPGSKEHIKECIAELKTRQFYYHNISGKHHTEWLSIMRKWIMKKVKFDDNGNVNPCVIVLDYIKMMNLNDSGNFQEYQYLGQIATDLHNFCIQYNIPMIGFVQLNRDGITKEDQSVIAGSDRLLDLCSSFTILKNKSQEDYSDDANGPNEGNKKFIVIATRFGPGNDEGEYINLKADLSKATIIEGATNSENRTGRPVLNGSDNLNI